MAWGFSLNRVSPGMSESWGPAGQCLLGSELRRKGSIDNSLKKKKKGVWDLCEMEALLWVFIQFKSSHIFAKSTSERKRVSRQDPRETM